MLMSNAQSEAKYFPSIRSIKGQIPVYLFIALMFFSSIQYASSLKSPMVKLISMIFSLIYPLVILIGISAFIPSLNYVEITKKAY